ncbi:Gp138 family membrane-puncturing spike protein [Silvanigrella sp.]|jgi:hypothetical protein|uniref:Gp138 family membrane-puncturing spike protein n=1 Tax=Silvanigrella sp. TaxID=2024976 RepID=UPI0037CCBFFD
MISEVIQAHLENFLTEFHTVFPAQVVRYNHENQCADLQPTIKKRFKDGQVLDLPILHNVPICFLSVSNSIIGLPIKENDTVLVLICERSIDAWINSDGAPIDPDDTRKFNLSDALAIPCLRPTSKKIQFAQNAIVLKNANCQIVINDNNTLDIHAQSKLNINSDDDVCIVSAKSIEIKSDSNLNITCNNAIIKADKVSFSGDIECKKISCTALKSSSNIEALNVKADVEVTAAKGLVSLSKHTHAGVLSGGSVTDLPKG